jgi:hypothetical protein
MFYVKLDGVRPVGPARMLRGSDHARYGFRALRVRRVDLRPDYSKQQVVPQNVGWDDAATASGSV